MDLILNGRSQKASLFTRCLCLLPVRIFLNNTHQIIDLKAFQKNYLPCELTGLDAQGTGLDAQTTGFDA